MEAVENCSSGPTEGFRIECWRRRRWSRSMRLSLSWMEVVLVVATPFRHLYFRPTSFFVHHYVFQSMKSLLESFTFIGAAGLMVLKMRLKETIQKQLRRAWVTG